MFSQLGSEDTRRDEIDRHLAIERATENFDVAQWWKKR